MSTTKYPDQRVGVFVDVQNLYHSAKALYNARVNFKSILEKAIAGRKLIRAQAYVTRGDSPEEQGFFDALEKIGFEVRSKELKTFISGAKKGDWDVGLSMDVLRLASKVDTIIVCSGDGDFVDLLEYVKNAQGCRTEVIAFRKSTSSSLVEECDDFIDLGHDLSKYTFPIDKPRSRSYKKPSTTKPRTSQTTKGTSSKKDTTKKPSPKKDSPFKVSSLKPKDKPPRMPIS